MGKVSFWVFLILMLVVVRSCDPFGVHQVAREKEAKTDHENDITSVGRARLKAQLKDPESFQIISERVVRPGKNGLPVGYEAEYRAKNSLGGYVVETFYTE